MIAVLFFIFRNTNGVGNTLVDEGNIWRDPGSSPLAAVPCLNEIVVVSALCADVEPQARRYTKLRHRPPPPAASFLFYL
jgi:hypothetical protein